MSVGGGSARAITDAPTASPRVPTASSTSRCRFGPQRGNGRGVSAASSGVSYAFRIVDRPAGAVLARHVGDQLGTAAGAVWEVFGLAVSEGALVNPTELRSPSSVHASATLLFLTDCALILGQACRRAGKRD